MKTVIVADGSTYHTHNWDRHFVMVAGQPLLPRIVEQFKEYGEVIVVNGTDDPRYDIPGSSRYVPERNPKKHGGADLYAKCLPLVDGTTNILLGDVRYTTHAVSTITGWWSEWKHFARSGTSKYTGKDYAEPWGFQLSDNDLPEFYKALEIIERICKGNFKGRTGPWEYYYTLEGIPWNVGLHDVRNVVTGPHWVEINDWTEDFDVPEDVESCNKVIPMGQR